MPVYEYKCNACGREFEVQQRMSDPELTDCEVCGKPALERLISRTAFSLKGGGWYKDLYSSTKPESKASETKTEAKSDTAATPSSTESSASSKPSESSGGGSSGSSTPSSSGSSTPSTSGTSSGSGGGGSGGSKAAASIS